MFWFGDDYDSSHVEEAMGLMESHFGEVRSLVSGTPTARRWLDLLGVLDGTDPSKRHIHILPYVQSHLERWPDSIKTIPIHWFDLLAEGRYLPRGLAQLPRVLRWTHARNQEQLHQVLRLLPRHDWIGQLSQIDLSYNFLTAWPLLGFLKSPHLTGLKQLDLSYNDFNGLSAMAILRIEHLRDLQVLRFDGLGLEDRHVTGLARTTRTTSLRTLGLAHNRLTEASVQELMFSDAMRSVCALDLSNNALSSSSLHAIGVGRSMQSLTRLDVSRNSIQNNLHHMSGSDISKSLTHLNVSDNPLDDEGARSLARSSWPSLTTLGCRGVRMGSRSFQSVMTQPWCARLEALDVAYNPLFETQFAPIDRTFLPHTLNLTQTQLSPASLNRFFSSAPWPNLHTLTLSFNGLGDDGLQRLLGLSIITQLQYIKLDRCDVRLATSKMQWPQTATLRQLDLSGNDICAAGLAQMLTSPWTAKLEVLRLKHCNLTDEMLRIVLNSKCSKTLKTLDLSENNISDQGALCFVDAKLPGLTTLDLSKNDLGYLGIERLASQSYIQSLEHLSLLWNRGEDAPR